MLPLRAAASRFRLDLDGLLGSTSLNTAPILSIVPWERFLTEPWVEAGICGGGMFQVDS
jgi:hypothetical protein